MTPLRPTALALAMALLALAPLRAAHAQDDERSARARRHLENAKIAYKLRDFPEAVTEFKAAYRLRPVAPLLFNIAQAERMAGNYRESKFYYEFYLRDLPGAANRAEVEEQIVQLTALIEEEEAAEAVAARPAEPAPPPPSLKPPETKAEPKPVAALPAPAPVPPAPVEEPSQEEVVALALPGEIEEEAQAAQPASTEPPVLPIAEVPPPTAAGRSYVLPLSLGAASVAAGVAGALLYGMARTGWTEAMQGGRPGGEAQQIISGADTKYQASLGLGAAAALAGVGAAVTLAF